jgi:hypothetical protein
MAKRTFDKMTIEDHREYAKACRKRSQESFDRCDTDGFLSQWASDITARLHDVQATILENGGVSDFLVLREGRRRVDAKLIDTQYGPAWILSDKEEKKFGRKFIPYGAKSRVQKKLGLREGKEKAPAVAVIAGSGKGLSGCASAYIKIVRRRAS